MGGGWVGVLFCVCVCVCVYVFFFFWFSVCKMGREPSLRNCHKITATGGSLSHSI